MSDQSVAPRADFPLLANNPELHYLDSAATAQRPAVVLDAMRAYYEQDNANPHRGAYDLSARSTQRYQEARERIAAFLGLRDADCLAFTRGTTESLNLVAATWARANIGHGDEIVVTGMEHHANFVPWQQVAIEKGARFRVCDITADGRLDLDCLRGILAGGKAKLVAFNHVSNALGTVNPVQEIAAMARDAGALVVCDGAQSAPHFRVDFDSLGVDFYAFSGHKMGGPFGIGGLIGRREILEAMPPYQTGGDMIEIVGEERTTWNAIPHKFEAGTPNVGDAVGLAAACEYLDSLGMEAMRFHEQQLLSYATEQLMAIDGVTVYGPPADERSGVVSFTVRDVHPHDLATILDQRGVCVRAGHHCCQPLMRRLGVHATARASFWIYSGPADVDALAAGVRAAQELFASV